MQASIILDKDFVIGDVDPRLYGGFAEHLGRHIYTGMYEPGHPTADEQDFRGDVLDLVRELDMPVMRYPGGNFVSGYNWEDGVGPREDRPVRLDPAWKVTETNQFGTNEFIDWCRKVGTEPILAVNLGTRGADEARAYVEYCNHAGGTHWSDLRRRHGYESPHGVKLWCLGNEMDGPWQMGRKTPTEYGRLACETAKLMKWIDPGIELVVCGSSGRGMATFGEWEMEVLNHTFDHVDYVSIHTYFGKGGDDTAAYLAWPDHMDVFIEDVIACADAVAAKRRSLKRVHLSFDEWNVWGGGSRDAERPWMEAPRSHESVYTMEDALCVGGMLLSLINHADRVKIGCLAQVVNVIAPIMTEPGGPAWRQTIFHPFAQASRWGRGTVLRQVTDCPLYDAVNGEGVPYLKSACVRDPRTGTVTVFALNRSADEAVDLEVELRGLGVADVADWKVLRHDDLRAVNTQAASATVAPVAAPGARVVDGQLVAQLSPLSWNVLRVRTSA